MTISGWLVMAISVGGVTSLFVWCLWKVLSTKGETEHMHGFEVEPSDLRQDRKEALKRKDQD